MNESINNIQLLVAIFTGIGALIALVGVIVAIWQIKADHNRRKKQATIEFYRDISDKCDESLKQVKADFPGSDAIDYYQLKTNVGTFDGIVRYLTLMEEFSVGINTNVFDIKIFNKIARGISIKWFTRFKNVIEHQRIEQNNPDMCIDFEEMVKKLKAIKRKIR